jgi:hypothetical protein
MIRALAEGFAILCAMTVLLVLAMGQAEPRHDPVSPDISFLADAR